MTSQLADEVAITSTSEGTAIRTTRALRADEARAMIDADGPAIPHG